MTLSAAAHSDASVHLTQAGRYIEALGAARAALMVDPEFALAHCNAGVALNLMHRHEEAIVHFRRALECDPDKQFVAVNLSDSLLNVGRDAEGLAALHMARLTMPMPVIDANLGTAYYAVGDFAKAEHYFKSAIAGDEMLAKAHSNLAICYLQQQRWAEGWAEYIWRFAADGVDPGEIQFPAWDGGPVKSLLVIAEQGLGEEILWLSVIPDLQRRGIKVWLEADQRLHALIARSFPDVTPINRIGTREKPEGFDAEAVCDAGDLGSYFRCTTAEFPRAPYLKAARRSWLPAYKRLTVGISWHSTNPKFGPLKSAPLELWAKLLDVDGVRFVDLQYGDHGTHPRLQKVGDLDTKDDIDGLASLISECDIVISVSNTVAHLACALGVRTWVLLPPGYGRFWYWGTGTSSPWYGCSRLFQNTLGWREVFDRAIEALEREVHGSFLVDKATRHVGAV